MSVFVVIKFAPSLEQSQLNSFFNVRSFTNVVFVLELWSLFLFQ